MDVSINIMITDLWFLINNLNKMGNILFFSPHTLVAKIKCSFITLASPLASVRLSLILEVINKGSS